MTGSAARPPIAHRSTVSAALYDAASAALFLVLTLGAVACTSQRGWTKAGAIEADFNRDSYECAREATFSSRRAGITGGSGFFREESNTDRDLYRACMRARSYQLVEGGQWQGFRD
jgi:hypothetical protein